MTTNHEATAPLELINKTLTAFIAEKYADAPLGDATSYVLSGPGKKVRGQLVLLSAESLGGSLHDALPAAIAIEMVHAYSLVHDDLPCIDNDDMRRGRPTAHVKYGEDMAVLLGDGLLTDAFSVVSDKKFSKTLEPAFLSDTQRLQMVRELALAGGNFGMVAGQVLDVKGSARHRGNKVSSLADVEKIHLLKSGALMGAACSMGSISAGASESEAEVFRRFGETLGLVFQIMDDLLDNQDGTGKTKGKDKNDGKFSYATLMSEGEALAHAQKLTDAAVAQLLPLVKSDCQLLTYARLLLDRKK
jgi:geranylgeranyl diphosphate synthase type II